MSIEFKKKIGPVLLFYRTLYLSSNIVSSVSYIPDTKKSLKMQNNPWHTFRRMQRSINQSEHVFLSKCTVHVISVAVIVVVV